LHGMADHLHHMGHHSTSRVVRAVAHACG
jgi:hypothetical protein